MANTHIDHHLTLLQHMRTILVALGEAEQILDDSHAMYLERYDELLSAGGRFAEIFREQAS